MRGWIAVGDKVVNLRWVVRVESITRATDRDQDGCRVYLRDGSSADAWGEQAVEILSSLLGPCARRPAA